jgi:hypothetical protein
MLRIEPISLGIDLISFSPGTKFYERGIGCKNH